MAVVQSSRTVDNTRPSLAIWFKEDFFCQIKMQTFRPDLETLNEAPGLRTGRCYSWPLAYVCRALQLVLTVKKKKMRF